MTTFVKGRPVKTAEAVVTVDAGLAAGTHRFQLVVVASDGRRSVPDLVDVVVSRRLVINPPPPATRPPVTPVVPPLRMPTPRKIKAPDAGERKPAKPAKPRSET